MVTHIEQCYHHRLGLSYLTAGEKGPAIVFLHGWGAFKELWWSTLRDLGRDYRCFAIDMPGHGESRLGQADQIERIATLVADFCADLGLTAIILVGHSMGGSVAVEVTLRYPHLVRRLALIDAAVDAYRMPTYTRLYLLPAIGWPVFRITQAIGRAFRPIGQRIPHDHGGGWIRPWVRRASYLATFDPEGLYRILRSLFATRADERLQQIRVPTLVLTGQFDSLVPPSHARRLAQVIPGARYVVLPASIHNPMDERPGAFTRALRAFLSDDDEDGRSAERM
ncbi:alpha/beta hydrolase [Chloroflexus sp. MS-CIW-1]|jgi:pimeloyl-ACP methyl ester carboxylesterase|uniref:alpha/beta fold hydrolase n=1 Tax=Chloroflexus sp. MS-CIW-1 TaxID=3055768 RepID=UPI001B0C9B7A|nr:alpha/beta hydrolase [Chloroflexus sp. MS-CIW-1]MBO9349809.1 alpha/beta hydrolase [Chloroflexus sp.]MDN5272628.1 alpha/beta hydrolase [Chloroflexus sp. MS-CIW-1]